MGFCNHYRSWIIAYSMYSLFLQASFFPKGASKRKRIIDSLQRSPLHITAVHWIEIKIAFEDTENSGRLIKEMLS